MSRLSLFTFYFSLFTLGASLPAFAANVLTGTATGTSQVNFTPWRMNSALMTSATDPHPDTTVPETMTGTQADTQFGRNLPAGFSQGTFDATTVSGVADFQSVVNRINTSNSASGRVSQLQAEINQNQSQAGYVFNVKFGITSTSDTLGNYQATGNFIQTRTEFVPGGTQTTTCLGTFTSSSANGYTLTSGTSQGQGAGCTSVPNSASGSLAASAISSSLVPPAVPATTLTGPALSTSPGDLILP